MPNKTPVKPKKAPIGKPAAKPTKMPGGTAPKMIVRSRIEKKKK